jgi:hypothetical protein
VTCEDCTGEVLDDLVEPARSRLLARQEPPYSQRYTADGDRGIVSVVAAKDPSEKREALAKRALRRANSRFLVVVDDRSLPVRTLPLPTSDLIQRVDDQAEYGWDRHLLRPFVSYDDIFAVSASCAADPWSSPDGANAFRHELGPCGHQFDPDSAPGDVFESRQAAIGRPLAYHTGLLKALPGWQDAVVRDSSASVEVHRAS